MTQPRDAKGRFIKSPQVTRHRELRGRVETDAAFALWALIGAFACVVGAASLMALLVYVVTG